MEKNEPSFVPEWLRNKLNRGSGPRFISSLAGNRSSSNSQRSPSSNVSSNRHDRNSYSRSYSSSRNQYSQNRERITVDTRDLEYSDPLSNLPGRRLENSSLGRSKSTNSGSAVKSFQERDFANLRNRGNYGNGNGNGAYSVRRGSSGTHESYRNEIRSYGRDERNTRVDVYRVTSPGLSSRAQSLSSGSSPSLVSEGWTSVLVEVPIGAVGSKMVSSADGRQQPSDAADCPSAPASTATLRAVGSNGSNAAEASIQTPVPSVRVPQRPQVPRSEEFRLSGNKKLIPMTPSTPQKMVLNPSDKLKPKTASRSNDGVTGLHQISSAQLGSPAVRGGTDVTKSLGMSLLKNVRANGPSISAPLKNANIMKRPSSLNAMPVADKRSAMAQLRSRNDFLNLMRKKSSASTTADVDSGIIVSTIMQNSDESKEATCDAVGPTENGENKCNGDAWNLTKGSAGSTENGKEKCIDDACNIIFGSLDNGGVKCDGNNITNGSVGPTANGEGKCHAGGITSGSVGLAANGEGKCHADDITSGSIGPTANGEGKRHADDITIGSVGLAANGEGKCHADDITSGSVGLAANGEGKCHADGITVGSIGLTANGEGTCNGDDTTNGSVKLTDNVEGKCNGDDITNGSVGPADNKGKCNGVACDVTKSCSDECENAVNPNDVIHTAEELQFLHALGWEDNAGDDEEGLTEDEISAFVKKYQALKPEAKLFKGLQLKMMPAPVSRDDE